MERGSGVLLHITSLPGRRLGREAYQFVDWLAAAGQSWWQVLPLVPPDRYGSPYKAASAFARWRGLLAAPRARVSQAEMLDFREREAYWIEDWARLGRGARTELVADQVRFQREWRDLRSYAADRGVSLMGDMAIYCAPGSVDHRAHRELFSDGAVAGAPPDAFSDLGQLWGNPVYDWHALRETGFRWWVERLRHELASFDAVRLDHFRGFVSYWAVPVGAADARSGRWRRGPGAPLFESFQRELGAGLPVVAEDLGSITPAVERLRDQFSLPGMLVLQFGFYPGAPRYSPHAFVNHVRDRVVYTGTHDHDTIAGWYAGLQASTRARVDAVCRAADVWEPEPWWRLVRLCLASRAAVSIVQAQDVLGLGSEARMNDPGRRGRNWRWRMEPGALSAGLAARLREATEAAGRLRSG
ncbi:MAG TPA: 4-alpha-glucanotransferase [Solirubrobacteraceae bacterium]|nr:4-alpha-glucanotransferase [Solirubrobacteraceae bacterium]